MIKRSRANRTERATFQNIRNEHKFIDVVHHGDGHYYMMLEAANIMMDLDKERRQAMRRMEEIRRRIETVASGDLTEEQCRRDAVGMFDKSNTPEEWGYARMFLATKYGEELASEIIEEVEK